MESVKTYKCVGYMEERSRAGGERWVKVSDFDRVTFLCDDLDDQVTSLEQRRYAEQQAREEAERRVDELSAQVAKLEGDNRSMRALMRKRHKQHQSRKHTLRAVVKGVLNAEQVKP